MGGVPIFAGALFSIILWFNNNNGQDQKYLFSALVIFFIIGLRDDLIPMKPRFKLLSQMIPILLVVMLSNVQLTSFYSIAMWEFSYIISIIISTFTLIVITNSFNLIDGIDGLSGTIGSIILTTLGIWFYHSGNEQLSFICFAFLGGLVSFLIYNWSPSKIFMGDTGALLLGFLIGALSIHFINLNYNANLDTSLKFQGTISTIICVLIIPLIDTSRVFILRLLKKQSPLIADNNHIHHALISLGLTHSKSTILLGSINIGFIVVAFVGRSLGDKAMLVIIGGLVSILLITLNFCLKRKAKA